MSRQWTEPHFGIQLLQGLPLGKAAIVEDYGHGFVVASLRNWSNNSTTPHPGPYLYSQGFGDVLSAREWAETEIKFMLGEY